LHRVHSVTSISKKDHSEVFEVLPISGLFGYRLENKLEIFAAARNQTVDKTFVALCVISIVAFDLMSVG